MENSDLETAINSAKNKSPEMSKEEEIAFHKGSINVLLSERNELLKMLSNVEGIASAHLKRLKELGVEIKN